MDAVPSTSVPPTSSPLVQVDDLVAQLASPRPPRVLDVRWRLGGPPGRVAYDAGHLPGAVFVDLDTELAGPPGPGRPPPAARDRTAPGSGATRRDRRRRSRRRVRRGDATVAARAVVGSARCRPRRRPRSSTGATRRGPRPGSRSRPTPRRRRGDVRRTALAACRCSVPTRPPSWPAPASCSTPRAAERYRGEVEPVDPDCRSRARSRSVRRRARTWEPTGASGHRPSCGRRFAAMGADGSRPVGAYCGSGGDRRARGARARPRRSRRRALRRSWSNWVAESRPVAVGHTPAPQP
jgi:thiosulfate/3-mercaptopyruvate sulfurtransferase